MSTFDASIAWGRREHIGLAIERTYVPGSPPRVLDIHSNAKEMHPVDILARTVEAEGMKHLLGMIKKKELQKMCEFAKIHVDTDDKRQFVKTLQQAWTDTGTKKFLKKSVCDGHIAMMCKTLGIYCAGVSDRNYSVEQIIRQLNIVGLEHFSKKSSG